MTSREEERRPLLSEQYQNGDNTIVTNDVQQAKSEEEKTKQKKFFRQLLILFFVRLCEPVAFLCIFPFINQMINDLGTPASETGYKAGQIEGLFALAQFFTTFIFTKFANKIGRKPIMLVGLVGVSIAASLFGLAKSYAWMVFMRTTAGVLSGYMAIVKTMVGEISTAENKELAFSLVTTSYEIGNLIGPMIGGSLAKPATRYPSVFGDSQFLKDYPYALPCFISSIFPLAGAILIYFFLEETGPVQKTSKVSGSKIDEEDNSVWSLFTQSFNIYIITSVATAFLFVSLTVLVPLFAFQSLENGGIAFNEQESGIALSMRGLACIIIQLFLFPPISKKIGLVNCSKYSVAMFIFCYAGMPCVSWVARHFEGQASQKILVWLSFVPVLIFGSLSAVSLVALNVLTGEFPTTRANLATAFGVIQSVNSLSRAVSPVISTSLYTISIKSRVLGGHANLCWLVEALLSVVTFMLWYGVRLPKVNWRTREKLEQERVEEEERQRQSQESQTQEQDSQDTRPLLVDSSSNRP